MSEPVKQWAKRANQRFAHLSDAVIQQGLFLRDPIRRMTIDPSLFFSPADGTIMYQEVVDPHQDLLDIKGYRYTMRDLLEQEFEQKCLVIGIFMTYYDVHVNRIPYGGMLKFRSLTPITTANKPMDPVENDILANHLGRAYKDMAIYLRYNARMVNEVYVPDLDYRYYITQIADTEVNVITHFTVLQNQWFNQGERFSFVRWGSHVELVLPIDRRYDLKPLVPRLHHVEAALDALVKIERR